MDNEDLKLAEEHLREAHEELAVAKTAEKAAREELEIAEKAEEAALHDTEAALKEIEEAQRCRLIHFKVDGESYETREKRLTPNQIIRKFAERDPATYYLKELTPQARSFKGEGDKEVEMIDGMTFVVVSTGPMTVSYGA